MLRRRVRFHAIVAYTFDVLVVVGNFFLRLIATHKDNSDNAFLLFGQALGSLAYIVVDLERAFRQFGASRSVPLAAISGSNGRFEDEWLQTLVTDV